MKIYRVQHSQDKQGPYRSPYYRDLKFDSYEMQEAFEILFEEIVAEHSGEMDHPGWREDFNETSWRNADKYAAGFETIFQLREWFGDFLEKLIDCGYIIVCNEVPEDRIEFSDTQLRYEFAYTESSTIITQRDEYAYEMRKVLSNV